MRFGLELGSELELGLEVRVRVRVEVEVGLGVRPRFTAYSAITDQLRAATRSSHSPRRAAEPVG